MKTFNCLLLTLAVCSSLQSQILGNYKRQQNATFSEVKTTLGITNQYRSVAKAATISGENTMEVSINALSNQKASAYTAIFNVVQLGQTAESTNAALSNRIESFTGGLKSIGLADGDIYVDLVNFLPKYEFDVSKKLFSKKSFKEIPIGFELQKNVHIRFTDPSLLDKILSAAAAQEIYDIVKVDYFVSNSDEIYAELRATALNYLNDIKRQYLAIGIELDSAYVITGENAWVAYPNDRYQSYQAFSSQKLTTQQKQDSKIDQVDKPVSRFYDAIAANDYDIVINPEILEPAVQYSYNLVVRFTLPERIPKRKVERQKEFILVTPEGEVKTLKIQ